MTPPEENNQELRLDSWPTGRPTWLSTGEKALLQHYQSPLELLGERLFRSRDRSYRFVRVLWFDLGNAVVGDAPTLTALLKRQIQYRTDFLFPAPRPLDRAEAIHGPYGLDAIDEGSYEAVPAAAVLADLSEFLEPDEQPAARAFLTEVSNAVVDVVARSAESYRLRHLGWDSHTTGGMPVDLQEWVVVDPVCRELVLVAAFTD